MAAKRVPKDNPELLKKVLAWHSTAVEADSDWQERAEAAAAFKAGRQWTKRELEIARDEGRNLLTFNFTKPLIDLVDGVIVQNELRIYADPTEKTDQFLCDVLNDVIEYVDEVTDALSVENEAADDAITTGRGFVAIDVAPDPSRPTDIHLTETDVPVYEIRLDPAGRRPDLKDHRFIFRDKWIKREDFKIDYPEFKDDIDAIFSGVDVSVLPPGGAIDMIGDVFDLDDDNDESDYDTPISLDTRYYDRTNDQVRICHCEYWEYYERYYGFNPATGKIEEFQKENLKALKEAFPRKFGIDFEYETVGDKKVKWLQFIKHRILYDGDSPMPFKGFSIVPMFGYRDKSRDGLREFGIVEQVKDTNREINKRYNQMLHLLMSQGKGVMAEKNAFEDWKQAEATWTDPERITWVSDGALAQGKIQEKPGVTLSQGLFQLDEANQQKMKAISGINPDLLGMDRGRAEPGVVIQLRQRQGMILLETILRNYRRMRKELFKRKVSIIMKYMPDEQIARILGQTDKYEIRGGMVIDKRDNLVAPIRNVRDIEYNTKVVDSPMNSSKRMMVLAQYMEMLKSGFPVDPKAVVNKMEITASDKSDWLKFIDEMQSSNAKAAEAKQQLEMAKIQGELAFKSKKLESDYKLGVMGVMQRQKDAEMTFKARNDDSMRDFQVAMAKLDGDTQQKLADFIMSIADKARPAASEPVTQGGSIK